MEVCDCVVAGLLLKKRAKRAAIPSMVIFLFLAMPSYHEKQGKAASTKGEKVIQQRGLHELKLSKCISPIGVIRHSVRNRQVEHLQMVQEGELSQKAPLHLPLNALYQLGSYPVDEEAFGEVLASESQQSSHTTQFQSQFTMQE
ncbi:uncharacterized protein BDR25DRAFT_353969 [Lindgomyces ingoldianus]|uniref:Uncharacterized protein n=1 Tax=Lindgomyces ingoldianus TaxID=673940 RepID=A0ACB6R0F2_9PLEO|nr:uncharacterized protein BDR25DRAFT_353969 [Lindgomyces ingoldianus]KAF2472270.1 hypothetical protein BDR25DRAFT_353969 [Lindgomyces ingoldianus]